MASGGKKTKKTKGKTIALNEFLGDAPPPPLRSKTLWSDTVDDDPPIPSVQMFLPTAPRAARGHEINESLIPQKGPYMAYISNLPYEIDDIDITEFFKDYTVTNLRLPRDDRTNRIRGFGYVEFPDRASLVGALQITDTTIKGRPIRIEVADSNNEGSNRRGGMRDRDRDYDSGRSSTDWRASRSENFGNDDRRGGGRWDHGGGFNRDSDRDRDRGGADFSSNWREGRRPIEDRPRETWGDSRNSDRSYGGGPRRNFGGDRDRDRDRDRERESSPPGERVRPKLNLKTLQDLNLTDDKPALPPPPPKTEEAPRPPKPSAASIFGGAKPVDTSAREREIEERIAKDRVPLSTDAPRSSSKAEPPRERPSARRDDRDAAPAENAWARRSQQRSDPPPPRSREDPDERAPRHDDDEDNRPRSDNDNDRDASRQEDYSRTDRARSDEGVDSRRERRDNSLESGKSIDGEHESRDRGKSNDRDQDREKIDDRDRERGKSDDRDRERVKSGDRDRDYGRERYQPPSRDRVRDRDYGRDGDRNYNRDRDRDRGYSRDEDRDRGYNRDRDRDFGRRDRDYNRDRERGSYRDNDRYRGRDGDRYERDRDRGREDDRGRDADRGDRDRDRGRDTDRDRERDGNRDDRDRGREERRRPNSRETEEKDRDRGGRSGTRATEPKDKPKESRAPKEIPKVKEPVAPNYVAPNKYSYLGDEAGSE